MPKFHLSIEADSLADLLDCLAMARPGGTIVLATPQPEVKEAVQEETPARPRRGRPAKTEAPTGEKSTGAASEAGSSEPEPEPEPEPASETPPKPAEEHEMLKGYTLDDVKKAGSAAMSRNSSDPNFAVNLKAKLQSDFGAAMFSQIEPQDFARAVAMLESL